MDTRFSTAIHSLILISESKTPLTSKQIAESVGSTSSYIRKVLGLLKNQGIINSRQGSKGFWLKIKPEDLSLLKIYKALNNNHFFDIHKNSNDECIVGRHIESTLLYVLNDMENSINKELSSKTLADCINHMKKELTPEEIENYENL